MSDVITELANEANDKAMEIARAGCGGGRMTATEILRRMLDECGVEYMKVDFIDGERITSFDANGREHGYHEFPDGGTLLRVWHLTPAQAIAATLGSCKCSDNCTNSERTGTCHDVGDPSDFCCSECGVRMFTDTSDTYTMIARNGRTIIKHPNFCPNCGAKVVDPTTNDVDAEVGA